MRESKLIYTTDKKNPLYQNNMFVTTAAGQLRENEIGSEMKQTINEMKKSSRRYCVMPKENVKVVKPIDDAQHKAITWVINHLYAHGNVSRAELMKYFAPHKNLKYLDNLMQTIRCAVKPYVYSENGLWKIKKDCPMNAEGLIDCAVKNRGARFKKAEKKVADDNKDKLLNTQKTLTVHQKQSNEKDTFRKIIIDDKKPVSIEIQIEKISIIIKIG